MASEPLAKRQRNAQASSIPTGSTLPDSVCFRSLMNVSVIAVTLLIGPLSHRAVSMQWASRSPVTPLPAALASIRHRPAPPCGRSAEIVQSCKKVRAVVEDAAQPAVVDELLGERDGGHAAVVVPDGVRHAGLLDRFDHLLPLGRIHGKRLLAEDHLAGLGRGDGDIVVQVVRHADIDRVDIVPLDELSPIGLDRGVTPRIGELPGLGLVAGTHGLQHRLVLEVEEIVDAAVGVRVRPAHEAVTDHADAERFALLTSTYSEWKNYHGDTESTEKKSIGN